ncbi:MAG: ribosome maturation factor RimP [cyanobacterium endosymbiont of Rhopalodia gibba]|jgi:ribosome maturation factor RimP
MNNPIISQIIEIATPIADNLGLEVVDVVFQTEKRLPVLRIHIRNPQGDTSLNDCEGVSRALETSLDESQVIPGSYVLEISSPGVSRQLNSDRDFISFKGFAVIVTTYAPYLNKKEWRGRLQERDTESVHLNKKGQAITIPRDLISTITLDDHP